MSNTTLLAPAALWADLREDLLATPELERAAVGFAGLATNGSSRRLLLRDWSPVPPGEYVVQLGYHLEVSPVFWARATKRARTSGEALVVLHSHPTDPKQPGFSASDDSGEDRLVPKLHARADVPVASVVMSHGGARGRLTEPGKRRQGIDLEIVGQRPNEGTAGIDDARYDRQIRLLGREGQGLLRALTVGVVGAGGLGSHVIQQLLHLGIGQVVVVDPDTVSRSNISRLVGASRLDALLKRKKTRVARRVARSLGRSSRIVEVAESVTHTAGAEPLTRCDVLIGCTDNHWSRMVLNALAFQYYVPVLDLGVELQTDGAMGGRAAWLSPGSACLWCIGILNPERVRVEQLPDALYREERARGYIEALDEPAPAVVSINGVIASLGVTELLARLTRFSGDEPRPDLLLYRLRDGTVRRTSPPARATCSTCSVTGLLGAGDLGRPPWLPGKR